MDVVSIIVSIVLIIVMSGVSFYVYTIYCHPEDKGIGTSIGSKIIIVICQLLAWTQLLLVPLDVSNHLNSGNQDTIEAIYSVIYVIIFFVVAWVVPFTIFLYESDEKDSLCSRIVWSILFAIGISSVWCAFIFISYIWLSVYTDAAGQQQRLSVPLYIMICLALVGWIFLAINGAIGLLYLPFELIRDFFYRPQEISSAEAYDKKEDIQAKSIELIDMGERLKSKQKEFRSETLNWFAKRRRQSNLKNELEFYKKQVSKLEESFSVFDEEIGGIKEINNEKDMESNLEKKKRSPIIYCLFIFFGIISALISLCWIIQLFGTTLRSDGNPLFTFIDPLLINLSQGSVSFLAVGIYSLMVFYLQGCAVKGNVVFGLRIPFILNFHPMKKDRTYLNSFLFNVSMMMLCSIATTELSVIAFPEYLQNSFLGSLFTNVVFTLPMFGWLYGNRVFMDAFCIIVIITFIYLIYQIVRMCLESRKRNAQKAEKAEK